MTLENLRIIGWILFGVGTVIAAWAFVLNKQGKLKVGTFPNTRGGLLCLSWFFLGGAIVAGYADPLTGNVPYAREILMVFGIILLPFLTYQVLTEPFQIKEEDDPLRIL